jgi:hypothetical protein
VPSCVALAMISPVSFTMFLIAEWPCQDRLLPFSDQLAAFMSVPKSQAAMDQDGLVRGAASVGQVRARRDALLHPMGPEPALGSRETGMG